MEKLKVLELFAGIGACSKALERLGIEHEIVDAVEIDKYAIESFNGIHGTNFEAQDITCWDKGIEVDLIMHGSPCQDFSVAGLGKGGDEGTGTRSSLMYETIRIVGKIKPKYVVWENVKNLLSKKHRHNFDRYLEEMEELGYNSYYEVLNSKDYGIPQNRERVFTISIREDIDKGYTFPNKEGLKLRLKDMLEENVDEKYYLSDKMIEGLKFHNERHLEKGTGFIWKPKDINDVANTLRANASLCPTDNTIKVVGELDIKGQDNVKRVYSGKGLSPTLTNMQGGNRQPKVMELNKNAKHQQDLVQDADGLCRTIPAGTHASTPHLLKTCIKIKNNTKQGYLEAEDGDGVYTNPSNKRGMVQKGMAQTLTGFQDKGVVIKTIGNYMPSNHDASRIVDNNGLAPTVKENHGTVTATNYGLRIRKLTPLECWRLQGFDDEDFYRAKERLNRVFYRGRDNSNSQLYKQAGNSITVNVLEKIFNKLFKE